MLVTHDMGVIAETHRSGGGALRRTASAEVGSTRQVLTEALHPYTRGLMGATPDASPGRDPRERLAQIPARDARADRGARRLRVPPALPRGDDALRPPSARTPASRADTRVWCWLHPPVGRARGRGRRVAGARPVSGATRVPDEPSNEPRSRVAERHAWSRSTGCRAASTCRARGSTGSSGASRNRILTAVDDTSASARASGGDLRAGRRVGLGEVHDREDDRRVARPERRGGADRRHRPPRTRRPRR